MHTILGSSGIIGKEIAKLLPAHTDKVRLVSRSPKKINISDELVQADLTDFDQTANAVKGSEVVYLTVGLPYNHKVWAEQWPKIMTNVIEACKKHKSKLVFFDNVYMYGKVTGWITEETPYNPLSKKGEIRAKIATQLMDEAKSGNLKAVIATSADFYGPDAGNSVYNLLVLKNLLNGKKAQWMANDKVKHSFTYTRDAAKGVVQLAATPKAYNQIWHLPTDRNVLTGRELVELAAKELDVKPNYMVLKKWMLRLAGLFDPIIRELPEMLYQQEYHYLFDSTKFEKAFSFKPAAYAEGIKETINFMKSEKGKS